jgi:hypothetical protein
MRFGGLYFEGGLGSNLICHHHDADHCYGQKTVRNAPEDIVAPVAQRYPSQLLEE